MHKGVREIRSFASAFLLAELQRGAEQRYIIHGNYADWAVRRQFSLGENKGIDWAAVGASVSQLVDGVSYRQSAIHQQGAITRFTEFHHFTDRRIPMLSTIQDLLGKPSRNSIGRKNASVLPGVIHW